MALSEGFFYAKNILNVNINILYNENKIYIAIHIVFAV